MREILFRGKCLSCKKFKHGDLVHIDNETEINALSFFNSGGCCCDEVVHVDTDTVGQYTGLTDKNGVKIFEGDIVSVGGANYPVIFNTLGNCAEFALTDGVPFGFDYVHVPMEVVGNIYDNPDLLGGDTDA